MPEIFSATIGGIIGAIATYVFTKNIENEKSLVNKKEEILFFIFSAITSCKNIIDLYKGNMTIEYDNYNDEKLSHDLGNLQMKLLHSAALIRAHSIETVDPFNNAYRLILDKDGFIQKRAQFALNIRQHGQDYYMSNKEINYKIFIETLEKAEKCLWHSSYKLIDLLRKKCILKRTFSYLERLFKCCEC